MQRVHRPCRVGTVPQHDRCAHKIEATGPVALPLEIAVTDLAQPVDGHGAGQRVTRLALVQPGMHAAAQLDALPSAQDEQLALDVTQFA